MIDPNSIGTALTVLAIVTVLVIAFGLALVSDAAMRRREDRDAAARAEEAAGPADKGSEQVPADGAGAQAPTVRLPGVLPATREMVAHAPTGAVAANGRGRKRP